MPEPLPPRVTERPRKVPRPYPAARFPSFARRFFYGLPDWPKRPHPSGLLPRAESCGVLKCSSFADFPQTVKQKRDNIWAMNSGVPLDLA
jgi:hypothetical protein